MTEVIDTVWQLLFTIAGKVEEEEEEKGKKKEKEKE